MKLYKLLEFIKDVFNKLGEIYNFPRNAPYLLEEINTETEQIVILCRGSRAYIKTTIENAIVTPNIIEGLLPMQACWLGYYYTYLPSVNITKRISRKYHELGFKLQTKKGRFEVISLEMNTSILVYRDMKTNYMYKKKITEVVQDPFVINNIDPTQACYIGMQAGYRVAKYGTNAFSEKSNKPILKLVK